MRRLALLAIVLLMGCVDEQTYLKSRDGTKIAYDFWGAGHDGVILIHGLDGSKADWTPIEGELQKNRISYVKIDLRGHGKSDGDWTRFDAEDFENMKYDIDLADGILKAEGVTAKAVIGASLGANLALKYAMWRNIDKVVLLSPGFNYRGIDISQDIAAYGGKVLVFASRNDEYAYTTGQVFQRDANATFVRTSGNDHGTELLPEIDPQIISFVLAS